MIVELEPELEDRLKAAAERQGVDPQTLVRRTLEERWPPEPREYGHLQRTLSPEEWVRQSHEWIASHRDWPVLPDEALQREDWYGERG